MEGMFHHSDIQLFSKIRDIPSLRKE